MDREPGPASDAVTRDSCLAGARREFGKALENAKDEAEKFYLQLCLGAVERDAAASPATQPATAPSSQPAK